MGFDNECVLNIQSLAGEYFCPVCRLLVYPNEALQSQCTHLYCKPCLKYVVSTTRACPYDGYLVTEADSKPLIESNKTIAETIGKTTVHCLYHRSGCPWQGPLSDCTTHCTGCAFGNSPVVCNRCGIQIVHRQVQEHAQTCPGVQPQAQPAEGAQDASTAATAAQTGTATSQAQTSTVSMPGKDPNQQVNSTTQAQTAVHAAAPTAEQWYQQYYQQYPGYDPYQQHYQQYYPYQAVAQYQQVSVHSQASQSQPQPQLQPQSQAQVNLQQETNPAVQQQSQTQLQTHPPAYVRPQPNPVQPLLQNVPQYQQPPLQMQHPQPQIQAQPQSQHNPVPQPQPPLQTQHQTHSQHQLQPLPQPLASQPNQPLNPLLQPQAQHSSLQAVTGHHSYPQPQIHQQMQLVGPQHPQGGPPPQLQNPVQMQSQFPQQSPLLRPPQPHATIPNQQPGLLPSPGQVPNVSPSQPQPVHSFVHQPGLPVHQQLVMQPIQQANQQYVQNHQPFPGQPWGPLQDQGHQQGTYTQQQMHPQAQLRPQGPPQAFQQPSHGYPHPPQNVSTSIGAQPHQAQSLSGRPVLPVHGAPTQPYTQPASGWQVRPMHVGPMHVGSNQQSGNVFKANNQVRLSSEQQSGVTPGPSERQGDMQKGAEADLLAQKIAKRDSNDMDAGIGVDAGELKTINSESDLRPVNGENKPIGEAKDPSESLAAENGEPSIKPVKEDLKQGADQQKDVSNVDNSMSVNKNTKDRPLLETPPLQEGEHLEEQKMKLQNDRSPISQGSGRFPPHGHMQSQSVSVDGQGKLQLPPIHYGPSALQQRPVGAPLLQAPPLGPPHHTHLPGHPPIQQGPLAPGHPPTHYGPPSYGPEAEMFPNQRPNYTDGRQGMPSNMMGMNMASGPDPDRFRPFPDEHSNSFTLDPARRIAYQGEFEKDHKHFPRPSPLDVEPVSKFGSHFFSARPLDRVPHGFGVDGARKPLDKGSHGLNYDLGLNMEPQDGSAPPRFYPPFHHDPHDAEGPTAFHNNTIGRSDFPQTHPGFPGSHVPGYDRRHVDNLAARSPGRDYPGMSSRGFGALPGLDDIHSRESRRFGDPISSSFQDNRFPGFPSRLHRGEIDGPGNLHMGEHLSGEFLGQDGRPSYMRRGDHFGPRSLPGHLRLGEGGFGASPGRLRMGELAGPGNFYHQRFGEPGFRSSFGGSYAGDWESFDNSRKRKSSMGWCRICKVDCETVEGLDLHSQTRDHQKMAMDMVITIKKNAKKQKSVPRDHSSLENASKTRNASSEGHGDKH